ncbi:hypothetical protein AB0M31_13040 [Streptomyces sp. NPDC051773]|uniref:hypothetical protein n=1 Tax=Streptomyces sp. NPDC051773 TaxID=3156682 RepID=UPI00342915CD
MSSSQTSSPQVLESEHAEAPVRSRSRRRGRRFVASTLLLGALAGGAVTSVSASPAVAAECSQGGGTPNGVCPASNPPGITGNYAHPSAVPRGIQAALNYWRQISWPNWRNVAPRGAAFDVEDYYDSRGNHHHDWIESGGQYQDHGNRLLDFMHRGLAGAGAQNYRGTFQEYYGSVYPSNPERSGIRTGNFRIVRAIGTGDVWVSIDHYSNFRYIGRP